MSHEPWYIETLNFPTRFTKQAVTGTVGVMMSQVNLMQSVEITHKLLMKHTDTKPEKEKNKWRERIILYARFRPNKKWQFYDNPIHWTKGLFLYAPSRPNKNTIYMKSRLLKGLYLYARFRPNKKPFLLKSQLLNSGVVFICPFSAK